MAEAIRRLPADIVAVQETWWLRDGTEDTNSTDGTGSTGGTHGVDALAALARIGGGADPDPIPRRDAGQPGHRPAVGARQLGHRGAELAAGDWLRDRGPGAAPRDVVRRSALVCSVTAPGGWPLRLVNTHLTHKSPARCSCTAWPGT